MSGGPLAGARGYGCLLLLRVGAGLFDRGLGGGEAGDGDAVRRARNVGEAGLMAELHRVRVATVFAADAELDARAGLVALLDGDLDELADTGLVDRGEGVFLHDFVFGVGAEEAAGVVTRYNRTGKRSLAPW